MILFWHSTQLCLCRDLKKWVITRRERDNKVDRITFGQVPPWLCNQGQGKTSENSAKRKWTKGLHSIAMHNIIVCSRYTWYGFHEDKFIIKKKSLVNLGEHRKPVYEARKTNKGEKCNDNIHYDGEILGWSNKADKQWSHHGRHQDNQAVRWKVRGCVRHDGENWLVGDRGISWRKRSDKSFCRFEQGTGD